MGKKCIVCITACAVALSLAISGCKTYGEGAAAGAATGALAGGIIGHQSGHRDQGAVIGAVLGGLGGLIAHDVKARKVNEAGPAPAPPQTQQGESLYLSDARVLPSIIRPGNRGEATVQYTVSGAGPKGVQIREERTLRHNGELVATLSSQTFTRTDGTWVSTQQFDIPTSFQLGEYTMVQTIEAPNSQISGQSAFNVMD